MLFTYFSYFIPRHEEIIHSSLEGKIVQKDWFESTTSKVKLISNPNGAIHPFPTVSSVHITLKTFIPREKRPEKEKRTIAGGWEGYEIHKGEYSIEGRVLAENYKTLTRGTSKP